MSPCADRGESLHRVGDHVLQHVLEGRPRRAVGDVEVVDDQRGGQAVRQGAEQAAEDLEEAQLIDRRGVAGRIAGSEADGGHAEGAADIGDQFGDLRVQESEIVELAHPTADDLAERPIGATTGLAGPLEERIALVVQMAPPLLDQHLAPAAVAAVEHHERRYAVTPGLRVNTHHALEAGLGGVRLAPGWRGLYVGIHGRRLAGVGWPNGRIA